MGAGKQGLSCHGVVESTPVLSQAYKQAAASLFQHYFAIETDHKLTNEEKTPYMTEWYAKGHDLLVAEGFKRQNLADAVEVSTEHGRIKLREGFKFIFDVSKQHGVPLLIFSAGIGSKTHAACPTVSPPHYPNSLADVLTMIIEKLYGEVGPQCSVVSNFMRFDQAGHLVSFYDPLVHMYNKTAEHLASQTEYQAAVAERPNVILLGDSLGDVTMADGQAKAPEVVLRIGFLNSKVDDLLEQYMDAFDVVVLNDDSAEIAVRILEECMEGGSTSTAAAQSAPGAGNAPTEEASS